MLVDAGPLIALVESSDRHHRACVAVLETLTQPLVTVWPAFSEAMYLVRGADRSEDALWGMLESGGVRLAELTVDDASGMRALMSRYRDMPMDLADAALVHVAERDGISDIFTLDRRHFTVYRIHGRRRLTIVP